LRAPLGHQAIGVHVARLEIDGAVREAEHADVTVAVEARRPLVHRRPVLEVALHAVERAFDVSRGCLVAMASKEPDGMEARIARLESDVAHIRTVMEDLKTDLRSLRDRMDVWFDAVSKKFDAINERFEAINKSVNNRFDGVNERFEGVYKKFDAMNDKFDRRFDAVDTKIDKLRDSLASAIVWTVTLYVALAGALLGTLARGFGWI
jgi:uncharacterized coiled-coil protein SlyX